MKLKEYFEPLIAVGVAVGFIVGAITYFATAEDLKFTQQRLEQKIQGDRVSDTKRMMYEIRRENKDKTFEKWSLKDQKYYQELELQLDEALRELNKKK